MENEEENSKEIITEILTNGFGETETRKWEKGDLLGKGGFARCYKFKNLQTLEILAAKIIQKKSLKKTRQKKKLISEIKIHKSLKHKNIVSFKSVFEDKNNVYILLELCNNQTMSELLKRRKRLCEFETKYYIFQIINTLRYLHRLNIIHRDLKLGNLFLSDMRIKIGDFGLASKLLEKNEKRFTICGTPNYIAPEILEHKGHSFEVDLWSIGVILYTILLGTPPFETKEVKTTYNKIKKCDFVFPEDNFLSENAKDLILKLLQRVPEARIGLDMILEHDFMKNSVLLPESLPLSTLLCPPSANYLRKYMKFTKKDLENIKNLNKIEILNKNIDNKLNKSFCNSNEDKNFKILNERFNKKFFEESFKENFLFVKKFLDYSQKYGIGYILSNEDVGVLFNDKSTLLKKKNKKKIYYITNSKNDNKTTIISYEQKKYPQNLKKKYKLFHYITNELLNCEGKFNLIEEKNLKFEKIENLEKKEIIFVKQFLKTKYCSLLKSNEKVMFAIFDDLAEIRLDYGNELLIFVSNKGVKEIHPIGRAFDTDSKELRKYLKYVRKIFNKILNI